MKAIRYLILLFFEIICGARAIESLFERANYTAIGFTGYVSSFDESIAADRKLKPLNRFERWLLRPFIEVEQTRRRECFQQSVIEVTGEDPVAA